LWAFVHACLCCFAATNFVLTSDLQDEIQHEETTANVKFLFIDCGPLKQTLTAHCELWKTKLTTLLNNLAAAELRNLHDYFRYGLSALSAQ
jgi:dynein heavy chain